jgi:hypothetical protein
MDNKDSLGTAVVGILLVKGGNMESLTNDDNVAVVVI